MAENASDLDDIDFNNFKGIYEGEQKEKFICPKTGAHFEYYDLCKRMSHLREQRKIIDQQLGIVWPSDNLSTAITRNQRSNDSLDRPRPPQA
jgi:hypothetical protein